MEISSRWRNRSDGKEFENYITIRIRGDVSTITSLQRTTLVVFFLFLFFFYLRCSAATFGRLEKFNWKGNGRFLSFEWCQT